jgi:hypothetical protein
MPHECRPQSALNHCHRNGVPLRRDGRGVSPGLKSNGTTTNIHETHFGATVLLGVTVPIYDGGLRRACEGQARADAAKTDAMLEQIRDEATREIVGSANRIRTRMVELKLPRGMGNVWRS